jgi:hypothetical protein
MSKREFQLGDTVKLSSEGWEGMTGVVSFPITERRRGHVLVHKDGFVFGVDTSSNDVNFVDERSEGFAQLAYSLIKLGSHVIERALI